MRKLVHLLSGLLALAPLVMAKAGAVALLLGLSLAWLVLDLVRIKGCWGPLNRVVSHPLIAQSVKPNEKKGLSAALWLLVSYTLVALFFPAPVASMAILVAAVCDPGAYLAGRLTGARPGKKSLVGSLAFLVLGILVSIIYVNLPILPKLIGVMMGALAERVSEPLEDNFFVPLAVAFGTWGPLALTKGG